MATSSTPDAEAVLRVAVTLEQCWHRVPGGTASSILDLVDALVAASSDHDGSSSRIELVGVSARHREPPPSPWVPPISVAALGLPRRLLYETWHRFRRPAVERATGTVDVIHATTLIVPPRTVPIVATLHDLAFLRHPDQFTRNGLHVFHAGLRHLRADAAIVLCPSEATADDAVAAGFAPEVLRVVPWGVRVPPIDPARRAAIRAVHGLPERYVLHIGTAEPRKNRAALVRAAAALADDVAVVLVGPDGWGDEQLGAVADGVHHLGFVSETDKWALLAEATVFCYPSVWEGFGLPVLEALAVGTPVVTSATTSTAEVAGDAAVLVDPSDGDALVDALRAVLDDADGLASRLRRSGPAQAARFTWPDAARATAQAYRDAARS